MSKLQNTIISPRFPHPLKHTVNMTKISTPHLISFGQMTEKFIGKFTTNSTFFQPTSDHYLKTLQSYPNL